MFKLSLLQLSDIYESEEEEILVRKKNGHSGNQYCI